VGELPIDGDDNGTAGLFDGMQKEAFKKALAEAIAGLP